MEELLQYEREKLLYLLRLTGIIRRYKIGPESIRFYCAGLCEGIIERF